MKVIIATDAWSPQVNGVVRTLQSLAEAAIQLGAKIEFLTPEGFASVPLPTYPGLRLAIPSSAEIARLDRPIQTGCRAYRHRGTDRDSSWKWP